MGQIDDFISKTSRIILHQFDNVSEKLDVGGQQTWI